MESRRNRGVTGFFLRHAVLIAATVASVIVILFIATGAVYLHYAKLVDQRLGHSSLRTNSQIYAAPRLVEKGDTLSPEQFIARLQHAGYTNKSDNRVGRYRRIADGIEITTGPESYFQPHTVRIRFADGKISQIQSLTESRPTLRWWIEPELITNVLDETRGKRRPVAFSELPPHVVQAVVSVEDKRFFDHMGLDLHRVAKAAYVDIREGRKEQGASTITMQLARSFWLDPDKTWKRKAIEAMIALELERRFTKEEIFQMYANEVYLGRRGSFSVHGFGEAADAYFGKDVRDLTVTEAATIAGIIQRPSYFNPLRHPDRVKERRNLVLTLMHNNGYLTAEQLVAAKNTPIQLSPGKAESTDAPHFVDLVNNELNGNGPFEDWDFARKAYRIYSTLDLDLQQAAVEAVQAGLKQLDRRKRKTELKPEVALIALDPHTGAIKALVGGRDYQESQLNRALTKRPPGSTFKPFVYAAALNAKGAEITAGSSFVDEPTTFTFNNKPYEPANFGDRYYGTVTVRRAMMRSLNIPTIKVAEKIGITPVVEVARAAGITSPMDATPALALGAYDVPPIELAEAYTIFSNGGLHAKRYWMDSVRDGSNRVVYNHKRQTNRVLDERVAYIMTNIMEDVIRAGTAGSVRSRGFNVPAAGKTGTAHDGWFAGYTSELLTLVWVGYDDYTDLKLEGSKSALPIWTEFMKKAHQFPLYRDARPFKQPDGIVKRSIDVNTGLLAGSSCDAVQTEMFVSGTEPKRRCGGHYYEPIPAEELSGNNSPRRSVIGRVVDVFR